MNIQDQAVFVLERLYEEPECLQEFADAIHISEDLLIWYIFDKGKTLSEKRANHIIYSAHCCFPKLYQSIENELTSKLIEEIGGEKGWQWV